MLAEAIARLLPRSSDVATGPIGIDFALESVHMVQLAQAAGARPSLRANASVRFEAPRAEILQNQHQFRSLVKRALDADDFAGRKAVIAVPSGLFRTFSVNYKCAAAGAQEAAAILDVMKDRLDGNLSDYVLDYMPVRNRSKNDERLALVAVSENAPIVELLELARRTRLDVQALEIGPVAISRLVGALSEAAGSENVLVINSGRRASYLTLISGCDVLFDQDFAFGEDSLIGQVASTLDMPEDMARDLVLRTGVCSGHDRESGSAAIDEGGLVNAMSEILKPQFVKLVEEIKRVCLYAAAETRGGAVSQVYLLGSIARWPGSDALLSSMSGVGVVTIPNPLGVFSDDDSSANDATLQPVPEVAVATGLALRGLRGNG